MKKTKTKKPRSSKRARKAAPRKTTKRRTTKKKNPATPRPRAPRAGRAPTKGKRRTMTKKRNPGARVKKLADGWTKTDWGPGTVAIYEHPDGRVAEHDGGGWYILGDSEGIYYATVKTAGGHPTAKWLWEGKGWTPKKKNPARKTTKRKPAKKTRRARKNPAQRVDGVTFKVAGRTPSPEAVNQAQPLVLRELAGYEPMKVTDKRSYFPWLVRRMNKLDVGDLVLLHALVELAEAGKVKLYVDEDRRKVMSRADLALCPTMGDAAEPLIWVSL